MTDQLLKFFPNRSGSSTTPEWKRQQAKRFKAARRRKLAHGILAVLAIIAVLRLLVVIGAL